MEKNFIKSPFNYIGGKYKLLDQIIPKFPDRINTFIDLFAGGYNVGINYSAKKFICNDLNNYVISLMNYIRDTKTEELIVEIEGIINKYKLSKINAEGFYQLRDDYNINKHPIKLFVLTCYSFNHQIRFNSDHLFNNPFGRYRSQYNESIKKNLILFSNKIKQQEVEFISKDFRDIDLSAYGKGDFIYVDPPYLITTGSYNDGKRGFKGWNINDEKDLLNYLDVANDMGLKFALSNVMNHSDKINELLIMWATKYNVIQIKSNYTNSSYNKLNRSDKQTEEVLIMNY